MLLQYLGGHVVGSSHHGEGPFESVVTFSFWQSSLLVDNGAQGLGGTEIYQSQVAVFVAEDVLRLKISIYNVPWVEILQHDDNLGQVELCLELIEDVYTNSLE